MLFPGSFWLVFGLGRQISPVAVVATPKPATTADGIHPNGFPSPSTTLKWRFEDYKNYDTDDLRCSSGMCKAGFAGDDAPRAVFRKFNPTEYDTPPCEGHPTNPCVGWLPLFCLAGKNLESEDHITNKIQQPRLSVVPVTMGK